MQSPTVPIVLGHPWLVLHSPHIDWAIGKIINWSTHCHSVCLQSALPPTEGSITPPQCNPSDYFNVPAIYHDLTRVFSKDSTLSLPHHRCYDSLSSGNSTTFLACRGRPWSRVAESLAAGIIQPSSSPICTGFFFVDKKDKTLHPV